LLDQERCQAFLADYAKNEYKKERRLIAQALEARVPKAIAEAEDLEACQRQQVKVLYDEYGLATNVAMDIVNALLLVLREYIVSVEANPETLESQRLAATKSVAGNSSAYLSRGKDHLRDKKYDAAIGEFSEAIKLDPNNFSAYNYRGEAYAGKGEYDFAISDFYKAIGLAKDDPSAYFGRGKVCAEKGQHIEAINDFNKAIELGKDDFHVYFNRGKSHAGNNQHDEAISDFDKAIELDEDSYDAYLNRGEIYFRIGKKSYRALTHHKRHMGYSGKDGDYESPELDNAIDDFTSAIRLNPEDSIAYRRRGDTFCKLDKYDKALSDFEKVIDLAPQDPFAYLSRGNAYHGKKEYDNAISDFDEAVELKPDLAEAYGYRGRTYKALEKKKEAIKDYGKALSLDPDLDWVRQELRDGW